MQNTQIWLIPSALSFLVPGLGQVYQRRYPLGIFLLAVFAVLIAFPKTPWLFPVMMLATSIEAWRFTRSKAPTSKKYKIAQDALFAVLAILCFLFWVRLFAQLLTPNGTIIGQGQKADMIAARIHRYYKEKKQFPTPLSVLAKPGEDPGFFSDKWWTKFNLRITETNFFIESAGPDRFFGTSDDLAYSYQIETEQTAKPTPVPSPFGKGQ